VTLLQIPYQTNKATLVQKIAELVENKVQLNLRHLMFILLHLAICTYFTQRCVTFLVCPYMLAKFLLYSLMLVFVFRR